MEIIILLLIGLVAGLLSGLLGVGGGIIIVPALVLLAGYPQLKAQGITLALLSMPTGLLAAWKYHQEGQLEIKPALLILSTFLVGSFISSGWAQKIPATYLSKGFGILLLAVGIKMLFFNK